MDYQIYQDKYGIEYLEAWEVTKKLVAEIKQMAEAKGADYILVSLANNEQVNFGIWQKILGTYPTMLSQKFDLEKPDKILNQFCEEQELTCLFMLPYFRQYLRNNPKQITHNPLEGHWNETGTNLVVRFLEDNLQILISSL